MRARFQLKCRPLASGMALQLVVGLERRGCTAIALVSTFKPVTSIPAVFSLLSQTVHLPRYGGLIASAQIGAMCRGPRSVTVA